MKYYQQYLASDGPYGDLARDGIKRLGTNGVTR